MERKRKLPPRAAARVEQASNKRRNTTPPQKSATPVPVPPPEPEPEPTPAVETPPPLPTTVTAGKPLPTVDSPQPSDLPTKEYQTVAESGVLAESFARSRHQWITGGIFAKYWSKPTKKKGVLLEDPNNPSKDTMIKLGQVTITVEPHVFEATMYGVKDPKPPATDPTSASASSQRPVLQYGPPNGVMPPLPAPSSSDLPSTPASKPAVPQPSVPQQGKPSTQTQAQAAMQTPTAQPAQQPPPAQSSAPASHSGAKPASSPAPTMPRPPVASPRGMESVLSPVMAAPQQQLRPPSTTPMAAPPLPGPAPSPNNSFMPSSMAAPVNPAVPPNSVAPTPKPAPANGTAEAGKPAPGTDPIILALAERAGEDPALRDLMKRVAQAEAKKEELERFQNIIDAITNERKNKGGGGPSADRLLVDGRTVRYFADEVRAIIDIVLQSNPRQTSADLRPPVGSDPLVVALVKAALDDVNVRGMVRRIAENTPRFSDATELQAKLDNLLKKILKDREQRQQAASSATATAPVTPKAGGGPGAQTAAASGAAQPDGQPPQQQPPAAQQALRSKGPPPPDITDIVFEFAGGTGDRYLFPKFSIIEHVPVPTGHQVICSFLLVRKGSASEYPNLDPLMDYYQPITIRLFTATGKHLEHLDRVVAPVDEVRRYMEDIMDRTTRAEYVLLAMQLPREPRLPNTSQPDENGEVADKPQEEKGAATTATNGTNNQAAAVTREDQAEKKLSVASGVLWPTRPANRGEGRSRAEKKAAAVVSEDESYQQFIATVSKKE